MSWGGSVAAMIQSLKANKALLGKRYTYFDAKKDYLRATKGMKITYQKATKEELRQVKEKIRKQKKTERRRVTIVLCLMAPLIIFGTIKATGLFTKDVTKEKVVIKKEDVKKYQYHIKEGDYRISKAEWNNAIFQYSRASEIFPKEYDVQYRLALAYTYKCQHTNEECAKGDSLVHTLLARYPDVEEVKGLRVSLDNKMKN